MTVEMAPAGRAGEVVKVEARAWGRALGEEELIHGHTERGAEERGPETWQGVWMHVRVQGPEGLGDSLLSLSGRYSTAIPTPHACPCPQPRKVKSVLP